MSRILWLCALAPFLLAGSLTVNAQQIRILEPHETALIEHQDRASRLRRIAERDLIAPPEFYEYLIATKDHGLADFPADIPILRVVFDNRVFFDSSRWNIRPEAMSVLDVVVQAVTEGDIPDVALFVAGHTDALGEDGYNYDLGLRRAQAVAEELVGRGIRRGEVYRVSFGEKVPVASNGSSATRALNRRVEFIFGARPEAVALWLSRQQVGACVARSASEVEACRKSLVFVSEKVEISVKTAQIGVPVKTSARRCRGK